MRLFGFLKKSSGSNQNLIAEPYQDSATNIIYNLLFCDDLELFKSNTKPPYSYPYDKIFSDLSSPDDLQKIIDDIASDPRIKILAYNKLLATGKKPAKKELLAVIVEIGLDYGLDVLASFQNGSARYINQTGKILIWENTADSNSKQLIDDLFAKSTAIINQIGPWEKPRKLHPQKNYCRLSFLVSDGLYFGEAPVSVLFDDPLANPALTAATKLLQYLNEMSLKQGSK
jgi:hypothetical protein